MSVKQSDVFMQGEGAAWLRRNAEKINPKDDPVLEAMDSYPIFPKHVLEVGCANGWRLKEINQKYKCSVDGIDPGTTYFKKGTADNLAHWPRNCFDLVIYGFCLYLCDPEDYLMIAREGDRVLQDDGLIIVYDFCTEYPYKVPYKHKPGLYSHHYDFAMLWLAHPAYSMLGRTVQDDTCVTILKKNMKYAFPVEL